MAYPPRQAEPGQRFLYHDWRRTVEFTADDKGLVRPKDEIEEAACIALGLRVAKPAPAGKEG